MKNLLTRRIQQNWKSGLTVALVSLPLAISLAVASQTSPTAGIITAVWAGLIAAFFGGSNFNIIGPTGALSGFLASYAIVYGPSMLPMLAIVSGIFILIAYMLSLEKYIIFIPGSVIHGFTLGVAIIIMLNQLNFILGLSHLPMHKHFIKNVIESMSHAHLFSGWSVAVFCIFLTAIFLIARFIRVIPSIILVSPLGIALGMLGVPLETLGMKFGQIQSSLLTLPVFKFHPSLLFTGLTVAFIAMLETLISAKIADGMTKTKHNTKRELFALGLANIGSGLFGGIPATAALARTTLNIKSGAMHRVSQGISSVCIAACALVFIPYFSYMPLAVIAAILVSVAIKMIEMEHFSRLFAHDKTNFLLSVFVAAVTVIKDPIMGIILGSAISLVLFMERLSHGYLELSGIKNVVINERVDAVEYYLVGPLGYINAQAHLAHFESHLEDYKNKSITLNLRKLYFVDLDGVEAISEIVDMLQAKDLHVSLVEVNKQVADMLREQSQSCRMLLQ